MSSAAAALRPRGTPGRAYGARRTVPCTVLLVLVALAAGRANAAGPYRAVPIAGPGSVARLRAELGERRFLDVLKLNRLD